MVPSSANFFKVAWKDLNASVSMSAYSTAVGVVTEGL